MNLEPSVAVGAADSPVTSALYSCRAFGLSWITVPAGLTESNVMAGEAPTEMLPFNLNSSEMLRIVCPLAAETFWKVKGTLAIPSTNVKVVGSVAPVESSCEAGEPKRTLFAGTFQRKLLVVPAWLLLMTLSIPRRGRFVYERAITLITACWPATRFQAAGTSR